MSTLDVVIGGLGSSSAPKDYTVKSSQEIIPLCITASINGASAASPFLATLEFISDAGLVMGRFPCQTLIAAGGSADVSWFPVRSAQTGTASQTTYEQLVLSNPHLRLYFKLDETSGTTMEDSGPLADNGTYQASPTLGQAPLADVHSVLWSRASLQFGQVLSTGGIVGTGEMSVAAWIKTSTVPGANPLQIVNADDNNFRYFQFRIETTGVLGMINFNAPAAPTAFQIVSPGAVNDGAKHFVVGTLSAAGTQTLYIDGVQVAQMVAALPSLSTRNLNLEVAGRLVGGPPAVNCFDGTLDEVAVYNFPLTSAEQLALYNAGV